MEKVISLLSVLVLTLISPSIPTILKEPTSDPFFLWFVLALVNAIYIIISAIIAVLLSFLKASTKVKARSTSVLLLIYVSFRLIVFREYDSIFEYGLTYGYPVLIPEICYCLYINYKDKQTRKGLKIDIESD